jgi:hypothetical protein
MNQIRQPPPAFRMSREPELRGSSAHHHLHQTIDFKAENAVLEIMTDWSPCSALPWVFPLRMSVGAVVAYCVVFMFLATSSISILVANNARVVDPACIGERGELANTHPVISDGPFFRFKVSYGAFNQYLIVSEMLLIAEALNATAILPQLQTRHDWVSEFNMTKYEPIKFSKFFDLHHLRKHWAGRVNIVDSLPTIRNYTVVKFELRDGLNEKVVPHILNHTKGADLRNVIFWTESTPFWVWHYWAAEPLRDLCVSSMNGLRPSALVRMESRELYHHLVEAAQKLSRHGPPTIAGIHFRIEKDANVFLLPSPVNMFMDQIKIILNTTAPRDGINPDSVLFYLATGDVPEEMREEVFSKLDASIPHRYFFKEPQWTQDVSSVESIAFMDAIVLSNFKYFIGHPVSSLSMAVHNWRLSSKEHSVLLPISLPYHLDARMKFNCISPNLTKFYDLAPEQQAPAC